MKKEMRGLIFAERKRSNPSENSGAGQAVALCCPLSVQTAGDVSGSRQSGDYLPVPIDHARLGIDAKSAQA